jgi:hypothetical protein
VFMTYHQHWVLLETNSEKNPMVDPSSCSTSVWPIGQKQLFRCIYIYTHRNRRNTFTGDHNTFNGDIEVQRCNVVSDPRCKKSIHPLTDTAAKDLVEQVRPYTYTIGGRAAVGFLSDHVPEEYTTINPEGFRTLDYNSIFSHLWLVVQLHQQQLSRSEPSVFEKIQQFFVGCFSSDEE